MLLSIIHPFSVTTVAEMLQGGWPINGRDDRGYTALMWAAIKGESDVVRLIIDQGGDIEATDSVGGQSALYFACVNGHEKAAELLISAGADVSQKERADAMRAADANRPKRFEVPGSQSSSPGRGLYDEQLPCGGKLRVSSESWDICYYIPGPDRRYKGTFITIAGTSIRAHIEALKEAWVEYEKLRAAIPSNGSFTKTTRLGIVIRIGGTNPGVCIQSNHMAIPSKHQLDSIVASHEYAAEHAERIQTLLGGMAR